MKRKDSGSSLDSDFEIKPLINANSLDSDDLSESNNYEMFEIYKGIKKPWKAKVPDAPVKYQFSGVPGDGSAAV